MGEVDRKGRGRPKVVPGTRFLSQLPRQASSGDEAGETTPSSTSPTENTLSDLPSLNLDENMAAAPARKLPGKLAGKRVHGTKHVVSQLRMKPAVRGQSSPGEIDRQFLNVGLELARTGTGRLHVKRGRGADASPVSHTLSEGEVPVVIREQQQQQKQKQRRHIRVSAEEPGLSTPKGHNPASQGDQGGGLGPSYGGGGSGSSREGRGCGPPSEGKGRDLRTSTTRDGIDVISISSQSDGRLLASLPLESGGTPQTPEIMKTPATQTPQPPQTPQQPEGKRIVVESTLDAGHIISLTPVAPPTPKQVDHVTITTPHHTDHATEPALKGRHLEVRVPSMGGTGGSVEGESREASLSKDSEFNFTSYTLSLSTASLPPL